MTKKGEKGTYHKPKPRVALYAGLAGSGLVAAGQTSGVVPYNVLTGPGKLKSAAANAAAITTKADVAAKVAAPAAAGAIVSIAADVLGVNKRLARMKAPFRV